MTTRSSRESIHEPLSTKKCEAALASSGSAKDEMLVDEAILDSFPASDPPPWTPTHAGAPAHVAPRADTPYDIRRRLRADDAAISGGAGVDYVARELLDAGRAVTRTPASLSTVHVAHDYENIEAVVRGGGAQGDVIACARIDESAAVAVVLGLARLLTDRRFASSVRLVVLGSAPPDRVGSAAYVARLRRQDVSVRGVLCLSGVAFDKRLGRRPDGAVLLSNFGSWGLAATARAAFRRGTDLRARVLPLPGILPFARASGVRPFWRAGWPGVIVTDALPPLVPARSEGPVGVNYDALGDLVSGLAAVIGRLAGDEGVH